ncbi:hypothetical protein ACFQU2_30395 [Siccirubricoccus deserti]
MEKHFQQAHEEASQSYRPAPGPIFEQDIGRGAHIQRTMPLFLTLRDGEGNALATAMLPQAGQQGTSVTPIVVGPANSDPYPAHGDAIEALGRHFGRTLDRARCYPYRRG